MGIDGGAGTNTIVGPNVANAWTITGANAGTLSPTGASGATAFSNITNITGGSSDDTLTGPNAVNVWSITGDDEGTLSGIAFTSMGKLVGGTSTDGFTYTGAYQISGVGGVGIDGGAGTNTITGPNVTNAWAITADNVGTLTPTGASGATVFSNIQNLTGGSGTDNFTFNGAFQISSLIDGGAGTNTIAGPNVANAWAITADNAGTLTPTGASGATTFSNLQNLTGGTGSDSFVFTAAKVVSGTINGGAGGTNTLNYNAYTTAVTINLQTSAATGIFGGAASGFSNIGTMIGGTNANNAVTAPNAVNTWTFTLGSFDDFSLVSGATTYAFQNFPYVVGGSTDDTFVFGNGSGINGTLDGGVGGTNTLDYSSHTNAFSISFANNSASNIFSGAANGFSNINNYIGPGNTFYGPNSDSDYFITGSNSGYVNVTGLPVPITFSGIANIIAGSQNDSFTFGVAGSLSGFIGGGLGTNIVSFVPKAAGVTVTMTGANAGTVSTNIIATGFVNIDSFTGSGAGADQFIFNSGGSLSGFVNGSGGNNAITDAGGAGQNWTINGGSSGAVNFISGGFSNIQNIIGGSANDTFTFTTGGFVDYIDGKAGYNTIDLYFLSNPITYFYNEIGRSGWVQGVVGSFINIDMFILPFTPQLGGKEGVADRITIETLQDKIFYEKGYDDELKQLLEVVVPEDYLLEMLDIRNNRTHHWWKGNEAGSMPIRLEKSTVAKSATRMPERTFYEKGYGRRLEDKLKAVTPSDYLRKDLNVREEEPKLKKKEKNKAEKFRWWKTAYGTGQEKAEIFQAAWSLGPEQISYEAVQDQDREVLVVKDQKKQPENKSQKSRKKSAKTMPDRTFYEKGYTRSLRKLMKVVVPFDYLRRSVEVRERQKEKTEK